MDKETACNAGDPGDADLIPGLGRPSGGGSRKWQPLQDSYLGNPTDRGACSATVQGVIKSQRRFNN